MRMRLAAGLVVLLSGGALAAIQDPAPAQAPQIVVYKSPT